MNMSVRFGSGSAIRAEGHFRGVSSFRDCALRKSVNVKLLGSRARRLQPGSATDRFFLISMCADDHYVKTQFVNTLAKKVGVYRVPQRYVRVLVQHSNSTVENLGVYLLIEDPDVTFSKSASALVSTVRRRSDPDRSTDPDKGVPFVKLPQDSDNAPWEHTPAAAAALARYDLCVETSANCSAVGTACNDALSQLMDFDMYLRWLAFCNFCGLGDYIDEIFWYTSSELNDAWHWIINGWDSACPLVAAASLACVTMHALTLARAAQRTTLLNLTRQSRATAATTMAWTLSLTHTASCFAPKVRSYNACAHTCC